MKFKGLYTAIAAFSLIAVPTMAAAAPVSTPLTAPAVETVKGDDALHGGLGGSGLIIALLALAAIAAGIAAAASHHSRPNSP